MASSKNEEVSYISRLDHFAKVGFATPLIIHSVLSNLRQLRASLLHSILTRLNQHQSTTSHDVIISK